MKQPKSIATNYVYNMLYQLLAIVAPLVTTPYVSRVLEADGLGQYSYALSIVTYFGLFGKLGLDVYGQLRIAESRNDAQVLSANFWGILIARSVTTLLASAAYLAVIFLSDAYRTMYTVLFVFLAGQLVDILWLLQGLEEFRSVLLRNTVMKLLCLVLVFACVRTKEDLYLYAFLMQGSILVGNLAVLPKLKDILVPVSREQIKVFSHFRESMVYFVPAIATSVYTLLDKSMLGWIIGSAFENGYYEQAHKIELILVTVLTSLSMVTLPRLKYLFSQNQEVQARKIIDGTMSFVLCISLPMMVGVFVTAPTLVPWFLGSGYEKCVPVLQVFSVLMVIVGLNNVVGKQCLMATGRQKYYNYGVIAGACTNIVLNLLLIPGMQAVGAAIASVASETVILLVFVRHGRDYLRLQQYVPGLIRYGGASLCMGAAVWAVRNLITGGWGVMLQLVVGVGVYFLLLVMFRDPVLQQGLRLLKNKGKE